MKSLGERERGREGGRGEKDRVKANKDCGGREKDRVFTSTMYFQTKIHGVFGCRHHTSGIVDVFLRVSSPTHKHTSS